MEARRLAKEASRALAGLVFVFFISAWDESNEIFRIQRSTLPIVLFVVVFDGGAPVGDILILLWDGIIAMALGMLLCIPVSLLHSSFVSLIVFFLFNTVLGVLRCLRPRWWVSSVIGSIVSMMTLIPIRHVSDLDLFLNTLIVFLSAFGVIFIFGLFVFPRKAATDVRERICLLLQTLSICIDKAAREFCNADLTVINAKARAGVFNDLYLKETMVDDCIHQTQSLLALLRGWRAEPDWSTSEPAHVDAIRNEVEELLVHMKAFSRWKASAIFEGNDFDADFTSRFREKFKEIALHLLDLGKAILRNDAIDLARRYDVSIHHGAERSNDDFTNPTADLREELDERWKSVILDAVSSSSVGDRFRTEAFFVFIFAFRVESMLRSALDIHSKVRQAIDSTGGRTLRLPGLCIWRRPEPDTDADDDADADEARAEPVLRGHGPTWPQAIIFGLKLSCSLTLAALLSVPSFPTRKFFIDYVNLWTLITITVLLSPTVGASNSKSAWRLVGTLLGCLLGVGVGIISNGSLVLALVLLAIVSFPLYYVRQSRMVPWQSVALIAQMTYCAIVFNAFRRDRSASTVLRVALKIAVQTGVGIGMVFVASSYVAPIQARQELQKGTADFLRHLASLYMSVVQCFEAQASFGTQPDVTEVPPLSSIMSLAIANEKHLLKKMEYLSEMLPLASSEPSLPWSKQFSRAHYVALLADCARCVDRLGSARLAVHRAPSQDVFLSFFASQLLEPLRRSLVERRVLFCYVLSGAMFTNLPLPPMLPRIRESRQMLLRRMRELAHETEENEASVAANPDGEERGSAMGTPYEFVYFGTFILSMGGFEKAMLNLEQSVARIVGRYQSPLAWDSNAINFS